MSRTALLAITASLFLTGCATPGAPPIDGARVLAPVERALTCPAAPYSLATPKPVPEPPKVTAGSYQALPGYVADLLGWIYADLTRSADREEWQRKWCDTSTNALPAPAN